MVEVTEDAKNNILEIEEPEKGKPEKEKKKRKFVGRLVRIFLLALAIVLTVMLLHQLGLIKYPWDRESTPIVAGDLFPGAGGAADGHLPNMTPEEIREQMQKAADASQFSFKINSRPIFANGRATGDLRIENPNYNIYPMVVQIFLKDTNTMIYDSGGILPNQHINDAKLTKPLKAGTYNAIAVINAYDPDTGAWQGKAQATLIITIQG